MRTFTVYSIKSILKTALITMLLITFIIIVVELFNKFDTIVNNTVPLEKLMENISLGIFKYFMMSVSISFLFATTFFLSQLSANNELLSLYNYGYSYKRIVLPIIIISLVLSLCLTYLNETIGLKLTNLYERNEEEVFYNKSIYDRKIIIKDPESKFLLISSSFDEKENILYDIILIRTENDEIIQKIYAEKAKLINNDWLFFETVNYQISDGNINVTKDREILIPSLDITPELLKNFTKDISSMSLNLALSNLDKLKLVNKQSYYDVATRVYQRLFSAFPLFVLVLISVSINYNFKKNILLFSIIQSLCISVVYYVANMVATIMGRQGVIKPFESVLFPLLVVFILTLMIKLIGKAR